MKRFNGVDELHERVCIRVTRTCGCTCKVYKCVAGGARQEEEKENQKTFITRMRYKNKRNTSNSGALSDDDAEGGKKTHTRTDEERTRETPYIHPKKRPRESNESIHFIGFWVVICRPASMSDSKEHILQVHKFRNFLFVSISMGPREYFSSTAYFKYYLLPKRF